MDKRWIYTDFYSNGDGDVEYCDITLLEFYTTKRAAEFFVKYKEACDGTSEINPINTVHVISSEDWKILYEFMHCETTSIYLGMNIFSDACQDVIKDVDEIYAELRRKVKKILKDRFDRSVDDFSVCSTVW